MKVDPSSGIIDLLCTVVPEGRQQADLEIIGL
jgi:hypothetical protein